MAAIGAMRERVRFEARQNVDDGMGNPQSGAFVEIYTCAAQMTPKMGGETVQAARLTGTQPMLITVRRCAALRDLASDWRIRDMRTKVVYNIKSFSNPDEKRQFLEIMAVAGGAN